MKISDDVKQQALQAMEVAHQAKAKSLLARLRICGLSFKDMAAFWRVLRAERFLAVADAEAFDAEAAEALVENTDAIIGELAGATPEEIVIRNILPCDDGVYVSASLGAGADSRALLARANASGEGILLPIGEDRAWGADGRLRFRNGNTGTPEPLRADRGSDRR